MLIPRVIPVLTIDTNYLVKTKKFKNPRYVGDPFNALRIFNEKEVDEVVILDISNKRKNSPDYEFIKSLASEAFMPLCYGGHISSMSHAEKLFNIGVEKISVNTAALESPDFVKNLSDVFGSQSIVVSIDVRKSILGNYKIFHKNKKLRNAFNLEEYINILQNKGAGEIILTSTNFDGMRTGYDLKLYENLCRNLKIPFILNGGLGCVEDIHEAYKRKFSAFAGSSMFVFHGIHQAVLITYPNREILEKVFFTE